MLLAMRLRANQMNCEIDSQHCPHCSCKCLFLIQDITDLIREFLGSHFHIDFEGIGVVHAVNNDLVIGFIAFVQQNSFNLAGECTIAGLTVI